MAALLGAFAVLFVLEVALRFSPWPITSAVEIALVAIFSVGWGLAYIRSDPLLSLTTAGIAIALHHAFRLVRAWADRVEQANLLPIVRGRL